MWTYIALYDRQYQPLQSFLKRCVDILGSAAGLITLFPFFIVIAIIIRSDGGPVFFIQKRIGHNGRIFSCYKFRSMCVGAEEMMEQYLANNSEAAREWNRNQKIRNDARITPFGKFIRCGIDELPQLFNVLIGDMSLVGPRPITPEQQKYYGDNLIYYDAVRPGITGLWQVSGRNKLTFAERIAMECYYARNWNIGMDLLILFKTIPVVLNSRHVY